MLLDKWFLSVRGKTMCVFDLWRLFWPSVEPLSSVIPDKSGIITHKAKNKWGAD